MTRDDRGRRCRDTAMEGYQRVDIALGEHRERLNGVTQHREKHAGARRPGAHRHQSMMDLRPRVVHVRAMGLSRKDLPDLAVQMTPAGKVEHADRTDAVRVIGTP